MNRPVTTLLALAALAALAVPAATAGEAERLLPDSTVLFVSLDDVSASSERISTHPLKALWEEEDVQAFLAPLMKEFESAMETAREDLAGASPFGLFELATGQVAFAITGVSTGSSGLRPGVVLLAEVGDNGEELEAWLAKMERGLSLEEEARRTEEDFRGTSIVTWTPNEENTEEGVEVRLSYCLSDGLFVLSLDPEVLRMMLVRRGEEGDTGLSSTEDFLRIRERTGGSGDLFVYANLAAGWALIPRIVEASDGDASELETVMNVVRALGLTDLRSLGLRAWFEPEGLAQRWFLRMPGARRGLMRLFSVENGPLMPPSFVPADVTQAATMKLGVQGFWKEIRKILDEIEPGMSQQMDAGLEQLKQEIGVDLEKDLIGSLGETMTYYGFAPKMPEEGAGEYAMPTPRDVYVMEVANPDRMRQALDILLALASQGGAAPIEEQEYLGVRLTVLDMYPMSLGVALVGTNLVVATDADDLRSLIRRQGDEEAATLTETEGFDRALEGMPRVRTMVSWTHIGKMMKESIETMQELASMFGGVPLGIDMSLLPAELFTKYFDVGGGVMVNEDDGLTILTRTRMNRPR